MLLSTPADGYIPAALCHGRADADVLPDADWADKTWAEFHSDVVAFADFLLGWDVGHGGRNCYEWVVADFAALSIGAIVLQIEMTWAHGESGLSDIVLPAAESASTATPSQSSAVEPGAFELCAATVGVFYRAPEPGAVESPSHLRDHPLR